MPAGRVGGGPAVSNSVTIVPSLTPALTRAAICCASAKFVLESKPI